MARGFNRFPRPTAMAHQLIASMVEAGSTVVDATVGNGHDTLFLSDLVGPSGQVIGFDIQEQAIAGARSRLGERGNVTLHLECHSRMEAYLTTPVQAVMFNLGYLPGGNRKVITLPETTEAALSCSLEALSPGGVITLIAYIGHEGGCEEAASVDALVSSLSDDSYSVIRYEFPSRIKKAPFLMGIQRLA